MPTGQIVDLKYYVEGMAQWLSLYGGIPQIRPGTGVHLAALWQNLGPDPANGYVGGQLAAPDGGLTNLMPVAGEDPGISFGIPGDIIAVQYLPVALDQLGLYQGTFTLMLGEPRFEVHSITIYPTTVTEGNEAQVMVTVENTGDASGYYTARLRGDFIEDRTVFLNPGYSVIVVFDVRPIAPGTYTVTVNGLSGTLTAVARVGTVDITFFMICKGTILVPVVPQVGRSYNWVFQVTNNTQQNLTDALIHFHLTEPTGQVYYFQVGWLFGTLLPGQTSNRIFVGFSPGVAGEHRLRIDINKKAVFETAYTVIP